MLINDFNVRQIVKEITWMQKVKVQYPLKMYTKYFNNMWIILIMLQFYNTNAMNSTAVHEKLRELNRLPGIETNIFINLEKAQDSLMPTQLPQLIVTGNISYRLIYALSKQLMTVVYLKNATGDMEPLKLLNQLLHRMHETKLLFVVQQPILELQQLQWLFNWSWSQGYTRAMALFETTNQQQLQFASYRPFPKVHVTVVHTPLNYFRLVLPSDFLGQPIRTPIGMDSPSVFRYVNSKGRLVYTGLYMKIFLYFIQHYNASIEEVMLPPPYPDNIVFADMIKALSEGRIDITAHYYFINHESWLITSSTELSIHYLVVPHAKPINVEHYLLAPFQATLWITIAFYVLIVAFLYYIGDHLWQNMQNITKPKQNGSENFTSKMNSEIIARYTLGLHIARFFRKISISFGSKGEKCIKVLGRKSIEYFKTTDIKESNEIEAIDIVQHEQSNVAVVSKPAHIKVLRYFAKEFNAFMSSLLQTFALIMFSQNALQPKHHHNKQLILMYLLQVLCGFLLAQTYTTILTSFLTATIYEPQLNSYADVIASAYSIEMIENFLQFFPTDPQLRAKLIFPPYDILQQHHHQLDNSSIRLTTQWKYDFYTSQQCFLRIPRVRLLQHIDIWSVISGFIMPLTSPYHEVMNTLVLNAFEVGLSKKAMDDVTRDGLEAGILHFFHDHQELFNALDLSYFSFGWTVLGMGFLVSGVVFLLELVMCRFFEK